MNFVAVLLQTLGFVPSIVSGVEGLFGNRTGTEKKRCRTVISADRLVHEYGSRPSRHSGSG